MTDPVLSVSDLCTSFKVNGAWNPVVKGISFEIAPRETLAIVGESGSGKSVTAFSIMQLMPPHNSRIEGSIRLRGRELVGLPEVEISKVRGNEIAMIFQEPMTSLNPVLTIGSQIAEALILHRDISRREAEAEALRLLEKVRIPAARQRFDEYPHRFSGGMRQRVMIAMALACKPKLLIADEPTTALDVTIQAQTLELIKALQEEEGMSVLFITHDMGVVAEIADRTIVMNHGVAVETGPTTQIFSAPAHPYTRALISAVPALGSMTSHPRPKPFPVIDPETGLPNKDPEPSPPIEVGPKPVLEVSGLTTRFNIRSGMFGRMSGRVHAVENVSFSVAPGQTLAIVGESGCGKSTIGRSLMRLVEPDAGSVKLEGVEILDLASRALREQRKRMQMIFQDPFASLDPRMNAGAAIAEPMIVNGLATRRQALDKAGELLEAVGLNADMASRLPHQFSGGQRQRICIARALAVDPKLIIADESVSALDVSVKAQVVNLMLELQAKLGLSYLFISHDMAVVERVSHRVAVMHLGEIVEIGSRQALFNNPQHAYTKKLLAAVPVADPARRGERRIVDSEELKSPIRQPNYVPPVREYRQVSSDHSVMI
ncbi:ABC transporter ATP-binding protein [Aquamicrobium sp. LC103]|uniref:ABC transporter ATP-binding protein n=1 Tax=Aquamicrobium sp. LC103 TaxID=1120658 RepID=UPI00063EB37D|nr:ABC transporter ATP-binding protein [Aquamicrobium sp. LC103]TKT78291.1 ABC transporter ATP-binding protein [Aquamicrobium sp. LC103]